MFMRRLPSSTQSLSLTLAGFAFLGSITGSIAQTGFDPAKLAAIEKAIEKAIAAHKTPGGVFWLEHDGLTYHRAYGHRALQPKQETMTEDTIFDLASLTKVVATTPAIMKLLEAGRLELDAPVSRYLPEFSGTALEPVTLRQLLTHTSGLRPDLSLKPPWHGYATAIELAAREKLAHPPGTAFRYSDINFILLGEIVQRVSGHPLWQFVSKEIYGPLRMHDTGFFPPAAELDRIAPTEQTEDGILRGMVHDPTARRMGGMAGHAGLFSTAHDLARYCRMLLNEGSLDGVRIFKPPTVRLMTSVQSPAAVPARRGLGWDIDSGYSRPRGSIFPLGSYGHTGWTGTCLWIDPFSRTFWIFLSNRVHPDGRGNILPLESELGTLAAEAVEGFDFASVTGALPPRAPSARAPAATSRRPSQPQVLNGIDVLERDHFAPLRHLRVGLITNQTGTDRHRRSTIDLLREAPDVELQALFSPEHGIRGVRDERVDDGLDAKTGLPIYSLYGARRRPAPEQLKDLDALVFDVQDIGCRFYTFIATLGNCLEAAGQAGVKFFVLDRVNPIAGHAVEGPVYQGDSMFIAYHALPLRHGMTVGELARMFNAERHFGTDLTVVAVDGWKRNRWFDETGLPWTNPSPNMRNLTEAILYPGIGLQETALSVGRGTDTPFEIMGAPYIDDAAWAAAMNGIGLEGIRFVPIRFTPTASTFKDQSCGGVYMIVTDRKKLAPVRVGIAAALTLSQLYPNDYSLEKFNRLLRDDRTVEAIRSGQPLPQILQSWQEELETFRRRREPFLLYR